MDGRLNYSLDRGRFLPPNAASAALGSLGHNYEGTPPGMRHQLSDLSRAATPSSMAGISQYSGRYFPPATLPFHSGGGYVMDGYLGGRPASSSEGLKSTLHQYPQYWAAQSEGLARQYGLAANSLYSPYLSLLHGSDPLAAMYQSHASAAALAQAQSPYHRIYDLRTDPSYAGLAIPGGQSTMYGPSLHSPVSDPLLLPPGPTQLTTEGKLDSQSSLEKLSQAVESAGAGSISSKRHSTKTESTSSKTNEGGKTSSNVKSSDGKREKKSIASDSKKNAIDSKESNLLKDPGKAKKDSDGGKCSVPSKTGVVLPQAEKPVGNKSACEKQAVCDTRVSSPQKKRLRDTSSNCGDVKKPKAVVRGSKVSEGKVANSTASSSKTTDCTLNGASTLSVSTLTTVTFTTSDSNSLMSSTTTDTTVFPVQPTTRMTATLSSNSTEIKKSDASEYLGSSSGPYHTVYSYTQQNKPLKEGSKVHAPTVTPEVGTLPSPVLPTCTTTVTQAKSSSDDVKSSGEGPRSSCCTTTATCTTTTSSKCATKIVDNPTPTAKKRTSDGKQKNSCDKVSKSSNQLEKNMEQLTAKASPGFDTSNLSAVIYPQTIDCHPRDVYGNPLPFPPKTLPFPNSASYGYDPNVRPIDLSSPKEKKRKDKVRSPCENSKDSTSSDGSKQTDHSTVPYRDIIHEYGQPRSHVTLLETHLPATSDQKTDSSPVPVTGANTPSVPWYDCTVPGQQVLMASRYMYPYGNMQPYYSMPNPIDGGIKMEPKSAPSSRPSSTPVPQAKQCIDLKTEEGQNVSESSNCDKDEISEAGKKSPCPSSKEWSNPPDKKDSIELKTDSTCVSANKLSRRLSPMPKPVPSVVCSNSNRTSTTEESVSSLYASSVRSCAKKNRRNLPRNSVKPSVKLCKDSSEENVSISGSGIPVGIAVARQRQDVSKDVIKEEVINDTTTTHETSVRTHDNPNINREEFLREQKDLLEHRPQFPTMPASSSASELSANLVVAGGNVLTDAARQFSASQWMQAGHAINPALWMGQPTFGIPPALPTNPTLDTSHLSFTAAAAAGFKLAQDPVTGQLFLIPATNLAYANTPFQHASAATPTVMATQPFTPMAVPNQPITAQLPPVEQTIDDYEGKKQNENTEDSNSSSEPQEKQEEEQPQAETSHVASPNSDQSTQIETEPSTGEGETTQDPNSEKSECPAPIAPQTAYIAGYPTLGTGQTYATYSYPPAQISYLYDPGMLSTYSMPIAAAAPIAETPVATVKPECPTVRSQGTSPMAVTTTVAHTIPTATVTAFSTTQEVEEAEVNEISVKKEVINETEAIGEQDHLDEVSIKSDPDIPTEVKLEADTLEDSQKPSSSVTDQTTPTEDSVTGNESLGAAEVLHKMKHSKIKKEKKKKDPNKKSEKKLEKKSEKKSEKKHSSDKKITVDKNGQIIEKKKDKSGKSKKSKLKLKNKEGCKESKGGKHDKDSCNYNPYTDPQILQAADGLELLSALAEKRSKCSPVEEEELAQNKSDVIDEYEFTDNPVIDINRNYSPSKTGKRTCYADSDKLSLPAKKEDEEDISSMFISPKITWPTDLNSFLELDSDTMGIMEHEMRERLAELQQRYKQKQKELAKLLPKEEDEEKSLPKRGPGRPRKRKFISQKPESQNTSASDSSKSSSCKESGTKKKKLVEKLVDRVFRKTGRDKVKSGKSKKKSVGLLSKKPELEGNSTSNETSPSKSGDFSLVRKKNLLKKAKMRPFDPFRVKSKNKSKGDKKHKSIFSSDKLNSNGSTTIQDKEKKSRPVEKIMVDGEEIEISSDINPGLSDSSDADYGLGILAKYASSAMNSSGGKKKRKLEEESDTDHSDPTSVTKRRKPGRPKKYCNPSKSAGNTETIVAKKPKNLGMIKFKNKDRKMDLKAQEKKMKLENSSVLKPLYLEDEWCLRRSERIFLSEPSPQPSPNDALSPLVSPSQELKSPRPRSRSSEKPKSKVNRSNSLQDISHKVKLKYSKAFNKKVTGYSQSRLTQADAYGRRPGKFGQYYVDSDSNTEESSDADDLPLSTLRVRAVTPEPRSCELNKEELVDGLRVLLLMDGLFHEGAVKAIRPPDVYGVLIDGERGNRPHIYSQEEILKEAILDVQPGSVRFIPEGTRVCAYWSQQFSCLYPGTVAKGSPNPHADPNLVSVEFDDGDSGRIPFDHIRMLPSGYPLVSYDTKPILVMGKRRRRTSEDMEYCRSSTSELSPIPGSTAIRWGKGRASSVRKVSAERSVKGVNLFELEEECGLKDNVFESENNLHRPLNQEKKLTKKKHKHRNKDDPNSNGHKHKKHKKHLAKDSKTTTKSAIFSGPDTSFATLAQSSNKASLGTSGFLLQPYDEKTYNWVMKNPLAMDSSSLRGPEDIDCSDNMVDTVEDSSQMSATEMTDNEPQHKPRPKGRPKSQNTEQKKKKVDECLSGENKTFLPTRQLWKWSGKSTKRPGMKGKARKEFYKAIQRGREIIRVGDCAVFLSTGRPNLPFVGRIENFWEGWGGNMVVRVKWFYHPEETKGGKKLPEPKGALFQSPHGDDNDVQTISHKCEVLPYLEYNRQKMAAIRNGEGYLLDSEELYYLAGNYEPSLNLISYEQHVLG